MEFVGRTFQSSVIYSAATASTSTNYYVYMYRGFGESDLKPNETRKITYSLT